MKRSITRWTVALATAGVLGLPVTGFARTTQEQAPPQQQQPQQEQPKPQQPPAQPQPTESQPTQQPTAAATQPSAEQSVSPQEHLRQAKASADAIAATSVPAKNRAAIAELKRHLSTLERLGSSPSATPAEPAKGSAAKPNWGTEVAAIDKIISDLVGSEASTPSTPAPTGTSGTAAGSKASSTTIDDATKAKLMEVRTHITAYAAGMAGAPSTPKTEAAASPERTAAPAAHSEPSMTPTSAASQPSTAAPAAQTAAAPTAETPASPAAQTPAPAQNPAPTQPDPNAAAAQQPSPAQPAPAAQPQAAAAQQPAAAAQPQMDTEAAHRHLVTARDTLSQLTQLPAAAQLSGEARTQVSQLITNFNELIGNPPDWRASYKKVAANLNTLLGPDSSDANAAAAAPTSPAATATPGAVGTTGTASIEIDPSIRAKLVELRRSLSEFQKASGGDAK